MIVQNPYNRKSQEFYRLEDVYESNIQPGKINSTQLEKYLARVNVGKQRRLANNHAERLAQYKAK